MSLMLLSSVGAWAWMSWCVTTAQGAPALLSPVLSNCCSCSSHAVQPSFGRGGLENEVLV